MKRALVGLVLALVAGGVLASLMMRDPGYVLLVYSPWSVETSLWFFLLVLALAYVAVRLLLAGLARVLRSRSGLRAWTESRRARHAHEQTLRGLLLLAEGEPAAARDALLGATAHAELPLVNFLAAARADAALGDWVGFDAMIERAAAQPGAALGVRLEAVSIRARHGRIGECRAALEALHAEAPRHPHVLRSLVDCYRALADWSALIGILDELNRNRSISDEEVRRIEEEAWIGRMGVVEGDALVALWSSIPKKAQTRKALALAFAAAAQRSGLRDAAEEALRRALDQAWDAEVIEAYGRVAGGDSRRRSPFEGWLAAHPDDAALWLAAGRAAMAGREWARAREYFETSLKCGPSAAVYGELGRLCEGLGELDRARECLLRYAELGGAPLPSLPLPDGRGA